ncbi:hypothetical protein B566_EDAN016525 [Ephemera danica]|nr:hypothetical protein B566_EDAN016525 [Ephemera danica]
MYPTFLQSKYIKFHLTMVEEYLEIYDEVDEDHKSKCRLCATDEKNKYLINIFGKVGRKYALDIKIRKCLPIAIREDDGMPKGVCLDCINKLDVSCELVDSCLRAHHTFLSLMNHDPARAKSERFAMVEDEECDSITEDPAEVALEELSDSVSTQHVDDFDMPVVIKDEPMDLGESEEEIADHVETAGSKNIETAETSAPDAVESVTEEPTQIESMPPPTIGSISVRSTETLLQSPGTSSDIAVETPAEVEQSDMENITIIQQSTAQRNVIIKEEPPGSPSRSFSFAQPTSSEVPVPEGSAEDAAPVSTESTFDVTDTSDVSSVPQ